MLTTVNRYGAQYPPPLFPALFLSYCAIILTSLVGKEPFEAVGGRT